MKTLIYCSFALVGSFTLIGCSSDNSSPQSVVNNCLMDPTHCGTTQGVADRQAPVGQGGATSTTGLTNYASLTNPNGTNPAQNQAPGAPVVGLSSKVLPGAAKLASAGNYGPFTPPAPTPPDNVIRAPDSTGAPIPVNVSSSGGGDVAGGPGAASR